MRGPAGPTGATGATGAKGDKGDKGDQGTQGPMGPGARWAAVAANATIQVQSGGITSAKVATGNYVVDFGEDVSRRLIVVSPSLADDLGFRGVAIAGSCSFPADLSAVCGANSQNKIIVATTAEAASTPQDHAFYLAAIGPTGTGTSASSKAAAGLGSLLGGK